MSSPGRGEPRASTGLGWVDYGVGVVALILAGLALVVPLMLGPELEMSFEAEGAELPRLTQLALTPWLLVLLGMPPLVMAMIGVFSSLLDTTPRRVLLILSLILSAALDVALWYAITLPSTGVVP